MTQPPTPLWPVPRSLVRLRERCALPPRVRLALPAAEGAAGPASKGVELVQRALESAGARCELSAAAAAEIVLALEPGGPAEGYRLEIQPSGVRLAGHDAAGLFYGCVTLAQLVDAGERDGRGGVQLSGLVVEDQPAFAERGVMLDVSRDRVPRLETLRELVELFAGWKLNRLQLYTEHTFAYGAHELVWRDASPYTADELRALDRVCREHHVELVPNQQSFGHMHRWLKHAPYRHLAECPEGIEHPFGGARGAGPAREPFGLCATDPASLAFLAGLYDELLPCFSSRGFNVGLDETIDLGLGRSRAACAARGTGTVYLDFLRGVHGLVEERGRRMQFWADIVLGHPELVPELPRSSTALLWGYEADHPFETETRRLAESGLDFQVAPGTSSWLSVLGRTGNMLANVERAATAGRAAGARGLLVTDWGDRGHLQPLPASLPGWLFAAGAAWNPGAAAEAARDERLGALLDGFALRSPGSGAGRALLALGRAGEASGVTPRNASALFLLLSGFPGPLPTGLTRPGLERARDHVEQGLADFGAARLGHLDAPLLAREVRWAGALLVLAADLGLARLAADPEGAGAPAAAIPARRRAELAARLAELEEEHRALWLERSRPGGLADSLAWLERIRTGLLRATEPAGQERFPSRGAADATVL